LISSLCVPRLIEKDDAQNDITKSQTKLKSPGRPAVKRAKMENESDDRLEKECVHISARGSYGSWWKIEETCNRCLPVRGSKARNIGVKLC
jgi:hypothetical protein